MKEGSRVYLRRQGRGRRAKLLLMMMMMAFEGENLMGFLNGSSDVEQCGFEATGCGSTME